MNPQDLHPRPPGGFAGISPQRHLDFGLRRTTTRIVAQNRTRRPRYPVNQGEREMTAIPPEPPLR